MAKITMLKNDRLSKPALKVEQIAPSVSEGTRVRGRQLQNRRWTMWRANNKCAMCERLLDWPSGFELDHIVGLQDGGPEDDPDNWQLLCVYWEGNVKLGCHVDKTNER